MTSWFCTVEDTSKGVRVMVGDRLGLRERLVTDLIMGLVTPALLVVPFLGMLIWASLGRGLRPLRLMARDLAGRDADDMSAIDAGRAPAEVRPLADALNGLSLKVEAARRHEREVTAFAAHELRTPLAGLKTQAQVAMATTDPDVAKAALRQILAAVDRTTRLVRQLLDAARLDAAGETQILAEVDVGALVAETVDGMRVPPGVRTLSTQGCAATPCGPIPRACAWRCETCTRTPCSTWRPALWNGWRVPVERASSCATRGPGFQPRNCPTSRRASSAGATRA